ncbi:MAG: amidohydrolase family protein [Stellaceae bacterium]
MAQAKLPQGRIDVHYHIAPPGWAEALERRGSLNSVWRQWSVGKAVEDMDRDGVAHAIVSITTPGVTFADAATARRLARECNEFAARMRADYPGRFGLFAVLPMPDLDASLGEVAFALDELEADGIGLLTSYDGKWLGDPALAPLFDELNRRKALVYTHPTAPECCRNLVAGVPSPVVEYGTDTSRSIAQLVLTGAASRYGDIRFIFSHAGGTVPFLAERLVFEARHHAHLADAPLAALGRFYYDTAQAAIAPPMAALRHVAPLSHILFGTDYPYRTAAEHAEALRQCGVFAELEIAAIERGNALALLAGR